MNFFPGGIFDLFRSIPQNFVETAVLSAPGKPVFYEIEPPEDIRTHDCVGTRISCKTKRTRSGIGARGSSVNS